ncbi:hypothetical protein V6N13_041384 [Hibiscus sabdariffa]|uniref:Uncharacterized protein n=1 Tax=Hibiscus sabdariffa TaxID=183260 RepID=A0ABR2RB48_9ROSI
MDILGPPEEDDISDIKKAEVRIPLNEGVDRDDNAEELLEKGRQRKPTLKCLAKSAHFLLMCLLKMMKLYHNCILRGLHADLLSLAFFAYSLEASLCP